MVEMLTGLNGYLLGGLAVVIVFISTYLKGRLSGAKLERDRQAAGELAAAEDRLEMDREATAAERKAAGINDDETRAEALKWQGADILPAAGRMHADAAADQRSPRHLVRSQSTAARRYRGHAPRRIGRNQRPQCEGLPMVRVESMTDAKRFDDLSYKTKEFLSGLRDDEVETLNDGIRLVNSIRTVGNFMKWLIVGILGTALGTVMFGESLAKIMGWMRG